MTTVYIEIQEVQEQMRDTMEWKSNTRKNNGTSWFTEKVFHASAIRMFQPQIFMNSTALASDRS